MITLSKDWAGQPAAVVAGGPSFIAANARSIGMARARKGLRVIAVNDAVYPCWFADILYAADTTWWNHHDALLKAFPGRKMRIDHPAPCKATDIEIIGNGGEKGFDRRPGFIRHGKNSAYQALHVAAHLGATEIILLGVDMSGAHWFGAHPEKVRRCPSPFRTMIIHFDNIALALKKRGIRVVNASASSELSCFDKVDLDEWLGGLEDK